MIHVPDPPEPYDEAKELAAQREHLQAILDHVWGPGAYTLGTPIILDKAQPRPHHIRWGDSGR